MLDSITPEKETKIKNDIVVYQEKVGGLTVLKTKEQYDAAADCLLGLKAYIKNVKGKRDENIKGIKDAVKQVENKYKVFLDPLETLEASCTQKMTAYLNEQYRLEQEAARAKEEEARKEREAAAEEAKNATPNAPAPEIQAPVPTEAAKKPESVRTSIGAVHTRKRWTFELLNIAEVPAEYLMVDTVKLNAQIKAGVREIPGVKIYETIDLNTRS